jgi:DNA primase
MTDHLDLNPDYDDQRLLAIVVDYYHRTLKDTPDALRYLRERGISDSQAIDHFRIGYANRTLGRKLPSVKLKAGRAIRDRLYALGLYRNQGDEHFRGCLVFPVPAADGSGQMADLYGRRLYHNSHLKVPRHKYLHDHRRGVWNVQAFATTEDIILCASLFDALTFWNYGYRNVTCMFGNDALTADHLAAFKEFHIRRVLTPCAALAPRLLEAGVECYGLSFPDGLDANAYACQAADPAQALGAVLSQAQPITPETIRVSVPEALPEPREPVDAPEADEPEADAEPAAPVTDRLDLNPAYDDQKILATVVDYYQTTLKNSPEALDYLRRRGITNPHVIDAFRIGYADRSLGLKLPIKKVQAGQALRARLQQLGLFRESGHEHFRGSITFPIHAADGTRQIVDIYGRKMQGEELRKGTAIHTHLNDKRQGVWNVEVFGAVDEVVLCGSL